jgi:hypothetical protein
MKKQNNKFPVVQICGLLTFSSLTLLGVLVGLPPEVILARVSVGTGLAIVLAMSSLKIIKFVSS